MPITLDTRRTAPITLSETEVCSLAILCYRWLHPIQHVVNQRIRATAFWLHFLANEVGLVFQLQESHGYQLIHYASRSWIPTQMLFKLISRISLFRVTRACFVDHTDHRFYVDLKSPSWKLAVDPLRPSLICEKRYTCHSPFKLHTTIAGYLQQSHCPMPFMSIIHHRECGTITETKMKYHSVTITFTWGSDQTTITLAGNPMRSDYGLALRAIERAIRVATSI